MVQNWYLPKTRWKPLCSRITPTAALVWHPRPLPGLGKLISEHRKAVPVWEDQVGGDEKSWKPSPQRDSTANYGQGRGSWSRLQELRVLLHGLCTFGKSQTPCRQMSVSMT